MYTASLHHCRHCRHGSCHHRGQHVFLFGITRVVLVLLLLSSLSLTCCSQTQTSSSSSSSSSSSPLSSFQRPELYHPEEESKATDHYFEGWYHKLVRTTITASDTDTDTDNSNSNGKDSLSMAVVPGVFYGYSSTSTTSSSNDINNETSTTLMMKKKNESHAFIFVTINGEEQHYYRFNLDTEFKYVKFSDSSNNSNNRNENNGADADANDNDDDDNYYIQIGNNTFSKYGMSLDLIPRRWNNKGQQAISHDDDLVDNTPEHENENKNENDNATITLQGSIKYKNLSPWPITSKYNLGAMGPIGYLLKSFLECYHDVLSFDHTIIGKLTINDTQVEEFYDSDYNYDRDYTNTDLNLDNSGKEKEEVSCNNNEDNNNSQQCDAAITDRNNHNNSNNVSRRKTNTKTNKSSIISRGYVEKDRGRSFPSLWIWIQTNSFPKYIGTSLFFSVARIPILTSIVKTKLFQWLFVGYELEFPGFTAAVWLNNNNNNNNSQHDNDNNDDPTIITSTTATATKRLIPFATWTGSYFEKLTIDDERVVIELNSGSIRKGLISILWDHYYHDDSSSSSSSSLSIIILIGRHIRAWFGSWFVTYDTRKVYYRLELTVNRKNVPHIMLYAPTTTTTTTIINGTSSSSSSSSMSNASTTTTTTISSKMKPFVNEVLNAKVHMRLYEYYYVDNDNNNNDGGDDGDDGDNGGEDLKRSRLDGSRRSSSRERVRLLIDDIGEHAGLEVHQNVQYLVNNLCGKPTANRFVCL